MEQAKTISHIVSTSYIDISIIIRNLDFKIQNALSIALCNKECLKLNSYFGFS
jgi:hypothetical protein